MLRFLFALMLLCSSSLRANEALIQSLCNFSAAYAQDETKESNNRFYTYAQTLAKIPGAASGLIDAVRLKNVRQDRFSRELVVAALGYCRDDRAIIEPFLIRCANRDSNLEGYAGEALEKLGALKSWSETIADPMALRSRRLEALRLIELFRATHVAQAEILHGMDDLDDAIREACLRSAAHRFATPRELLPRARRALHSVNGGVRAEAARCIAHQGSGYEVLDLARKLLAEPDERVRLSYLNGLGARYSWLNDDASDGADLLLAKDPSPNVRVHAVGYCSLPAWHRAMNDTDFNVRLEAFKRAFQSEMSPPEEASLPVALLIEMMQENKAAMTPAGCIAETEPIQDLAAGVLRHRSLRTDSAAALKTQLRALLDPRQSPRTIFLAARILLTLLPPGDAIDLYETREPRVLAEIARASAEFLHWQGDAVAFAVLHLLHHSDPAVATAAGEALAGSVTWSSSSQRIYKELRLILDNTRASGDSRAAALRILYPYPGNGDATLILLINDPAIVGEQDGFPLPLAAVALSRWKAARESHLLAALNDANPHMRRAALNAASGKAQGPEVLQKMAAALHDKVPFVRLAAFQAFRYGGRSPAVEDEAIACAEHDPSDPVRAAAFRLIPYPSLRASVLEKAFTSEDSNLRTDAVKAAAHLYATNHDPEMLRLIMKAEASSDDHLKYGAEQSIESWNLEFE